MKAVLSIRPGRPENLAIADVASPIVGPNELLIEVKAVGVNFPDTLIIDDRYQIKPKRPFSPGGEASGVVLAAGAQTLGFAPGDRVLAWAPYGCMAEQIALPASNCTRIPDAMPFDEAAAFMFTYATSWHALKQRAALKSGETLLVLGAAGGVGLAAVELGKAAGARVVAAVSSQRKADIALARGADAVVIYPRGPFDKDGRKALSNHFKAVCGDHGADVIFDAVGGDYAEAALRAIAWDGRFLVVGFPAGIPTMPLNLALLKNCRIVGVIWGVWAVREPDHQRANVAELFGLYQTGAITPLVSERYALADAGAAIARLGSREAVGKIVIVI